MSAESRATHAEVHDWIQWWSGSGRLVRLTSEAPIIGSGIWVGRLHQVSDSSYMLTDVVGDWGETRRERVFAVDDITSIRDPLRASKMPELVDVAVAFKTHEHTSAIHDHFSELREFVKQSIFHNVPHASLQEFVPALQAVIESSASRCLTVTLIDRTSPLLPCLTLTIGRCERRYERQADIIVCSAPRYLFNGERYELHRRLRDQEETCRHRTLWGRLGAAWAEVVAAPRYCLRPGYVSALVTFERTLDGEIRERFVVDDTPDGCTHDSFVARLAPIVTREEFAVRQIPVGKYRSRSASRRDVVQ